MKTYKIDAGITVVRCPKYDSRDAMAFLLFSGENVRTRIRGGVVIANWLAASTARRGETLLAASRREAEQCAPFALRYYPTRP